MAIQQVIGSVWTAVGNFFQNSNSGSVERSLQDRLEDNPTVADYGAAVSPADSTDAFLNAIAGNREKIVVDGNYEITIDSNSDADTILQAINRFDVRGFLTIKLGAGDWTVSSFVDITNPSAINISIEGVDNTETSVTAIGTVTGAQGNYNVPLTIASVADISIGSYIIIIPSTLTGTGRFKELGGCWKVTNVVGNVVTIKHTHQQSSFPTMTVTNGSVFPITSILRWGLGKRGIAIFGTSLFQIINCVLAGSFNISTGAKADGPDDGLQVGSASNTSDTGLNESHSILAGGMFLGRVGIVEWTNNGLQVSGGNVRGSANGFCSNGWRGAQAADAGSAISKFSGFCGNGASGCEAESVGFFNMAGGSASGNAQQGVFAISGGSVNVTSSAYAGGNETQGIEAKDWGNISAGGVEIEGNTSFGISCESALIIAGTGSTVANNAGGLYRCTEAGVIVTTGAGSVSGNLSIDYDSAAVLIEASGEQRWPDTRKILNESTRAGFKELPTSIGDIIYSYDTSGGGTFVDTWRFKADGIIHPENDNTNSVGRLSNRIADGYFVELHPGAGNVRWLSGTGSPEGSITAVVGSLYTDTAGGVGSTLWVKESGSGNTGWVAK